MMAVPILYGYAAIIFRHPVFAPYMPALAKLVLFSSMVHQAVFSLVSTLPFAIGQVQDAGLIFLSRMTTDVAVKVLLAGGTAEEAVATALAATAFATASMGVALVVIGKLKLARFVAYLPMPVVGGYLAFIGLFCLEASLGLSTGKDIRGLNTWGMLFNSRDLLLCLPCLVIGVLWSWVSRRYQHFAVLPLTMLAVPAVFYIALALSGESMQNARDVGLIGAITQPAELSWSFSLFRFDRVHWTVLPGLMPVWIGMIFVVAFSSSLDVAAIEIDMGEPLDTNKELNTVGWSNILSGLTGGFTGSYIFSQTLFTRRTGCQSRLIGWFVAVSELAMCVVTIDPMAFVPLLFFAATLSFIAVELSVEWLWEVREKLLAYEYFVLLATFVAIQVVGLNQGLVAGVAFSTAIFVISYASERKNTLERVHKRGRFMRPASQRRLLQVHRDKILCVELRGELFFGSSQQVLREVTAMLGLAAPPVGKRGKEATPGVATAAAGGADGGSSQSTRKEAFQRWWGKVHKALRKCFTARAGRTALEDRSPEGSPLRGGSSRSPLSRRGTSYGAAGAGPRTNGGAVAAMEAGTVTDAGKVLGAGDSRGRDETAGGAVNVSGGTASLAAGGEEEEQDSAEEGELISFIVLDCSKVTNIDASAARTCFLPLQRLAEANGVCIAYAGLTERMETLLSIHKAIGLDNVAVFKTFFTAVDWCETQLIRSLDAYEDDGNASFWATSHFSRRESFKSTAVNIKHLLRQVLELPESASAVDGIERYCSEEDYHAGELIFSPGDEADSFYVVTDGQVMVEKSPDGSSRPQELRGREDRTRANSVARAGGQVLFNVGAIFGYVDYQLEERRAHSAIAVTDAVVTVFPRAHLDRMMEENPRLLCLLERSVMKHLALELSNLPV
ncbi:conserved unknown protein [Ectocarpus siliculosus]|uniref:Sulfate transporter n=1 Tax=Ectocarpus siliculosus TaxID=2880 RepID=D8LNQ9_ECTSI|nr:conserved unknown protein [Ectocarpus siliculosus]|eukprot:CBN78269.1 conserved unknown protein [Ectocarpus siliculosus]